MSQGRMHKGAPLASHLNGSTAPVPVAKTADDTFIRNHSSKHDNQKRSSKNKIPKCVRYDLENALVGLCDVWFEEIKPHLVRNNIKLHVHGAASGDHEPQQQSTTAPACSHLDPGAAPDLPRRMGASYVASSLMPRTASRAPCAKPTARCRLQIQPLQPPTLPLRDHQQITHLNCEDMRAHRPYKSRRKKRHSSPCETRLNWRVPRLCWTYGIIPSAATQGSKLSNVNDNYYQCIHTYHHQQAVMKNKSTQTELSIPTGHVLSVSTQTYSQRARNISPIIARSPSLNKREGVMLLSSPTTYQKRCLPHNEPVLFQDDLIDIIGEKHDKRLKIIYNSPEQVDSLMNLVSPNRPRQSRTAMKAPWR